MGKLEVEGGEIAIKNKNGDIAIIPKERVKHVENLIKAGNHDMVDAFVSMLPKMPNKAQHGGVHPEQEKTDLNKKQVYWDSLIPKYGKGVRNRQIYIDLYDKEIKATNITQEYNIWQRDPNIKGSALESQNQFFKSEQNQQDYFTALENRMINPQTQSEFLGQHTPEQEAVNKFRSLGADVRNNIGESRQFFRTDLTSDEEYHSKRKLINEYDEFIQNKKMEFGRNKQVFRDNFNNDDGNKTLYNNPATTWRELIGNRNDIENKELLFASMMDEGADTFTYQNEGGDRKAYSGYGIFGLDTFGERFDEFVKKGYIDKSMRSRISMSSETNELNQSTLSANFTNLPDVVTAKNALMKSGQSSIRRKAEELGVTLSPTAKEYFTVASFNLGEGGARKMLAAYHKAGILKNDQFMNDDSYAGYREPHRNAKRRVQAANMLRGEGTLNKK